MKKCFHSLRFVFCCMFISLSNVSFSQGHVIGSFPIMDGGVENQTTGAAPNASGSTLATGIQQTAYTTAQATSSVGTVAATGARSGNKCFQWSTGSTSNLLWTPTAANAAIVGGTSYVVQFYYTYASGSARTFTLGVTSDGTSGSSTATTTSLVVTPTYSKVSVLVTPGTSTNTPRYGMITFKPNGGSFSTPYVLDDLVMYAGSAEDNTAPNNATAATVGTPTSSSLTVNWAAPAGGVDGGGYVVVRGTTDPATAPNVNGVYAIGNLIGTGTVAYIGTGTSFVDNSLTSNTSYFYRVYAVDKAFNYSTAATATGATGTTPVIINEAKAYQKNNGIQVDWSTALEINMDKFFVEKSIDGTNFSTVSTLPSRSNGNGLTHYSWFDVAAVNGNNFYRIKAVEKDGTVKFSSLLRVLLGKGKTDMVIAPNPVKDRLVNIQLSMMDKWNYSLQIVSNNGQLISNKIIQHDGGNGSYNMQLPSSIKRGIYTLIIQSPTIKLIKQLIVE